MDVLDDILSSLRLRGGVVVDGEFSGDFCVAAEFTPGHFAPFYPAPEKLISYHYVRSGKLIVELDGLPPVTLEAGSIAILPRNEPHRLASRAGLRPADPNEIGRTTAEGVHRVTTGTEGEKTEVWCGFLETAETSDHPLFDTLPPLLTLKIVGGEAEWLDTSMRFLAEQQPSSEVVAKLAELFLTQAVREYVARLPLGASGWLRGLTDPAVTKALSIIHARYAEELDVEGLAREAGVSRTVLGEKFAELIGEPPMRYCARWRMRVAANMLRDGKQNASNVAYSVGFNSEAAFTRAFKREYGVPPATWRRQFEEGAKTREEAQRLGLPQQVVRNTTAKDGTRLAYAVMGEGPPLVKAANWLNHLEHDWKSPVWRHWLQEFTDGHTLIRYDERANGMSDWETPEISFDAFVDDLECVVEAAGVEKFDLLGISQGASVAIAYAVRHPERVRRLLIVGGYAAGWAARADPEEIARREALLTLTEVGWGSDHPTYRQIFTSLYIPQGSPEQISWWNEMQRVSTSPANAVKLQRALSVIDVRELLPRVTTPTLIFHSKDDQVVPFAAGEYLAKHIPDARFISLEGENHILLEKEPSWHEFVAGARQFLRSDEWDGKAPAVMRGGPVQDELRSCSGRDGVQIAYALSGSGFPIVKAPTWMTHLEHDWTSPVYGHWYEFCTEFGRLLRMDMRGFGRSQWDVPSFTFEDLLGDFEAVIDDAGLEQFDSIGISHGAAIAIAYAARHPERVRKLVLVNSFAAGWRVRADPEEIAWRESLLQMNRQRPSFRRSLLGEMFITLYFPSASDRLIDFHNEHFQTLGPIPSMEKMIELVSWIDIRKDLANVRAPTLVFHADKDGNAPLDVGRQVADGIGGARFVELDSANHVLLADEPAWKHFTREARAFLSPD